MIPKLRPFVDHKELLSAIRTSRESITTFEERFAKTFKAKHALSFQYGRSAILSCLKAQGVKDAEVLMPAYTCVVVPNCVVASGNAPRFVDIDSKGFNMDMEKVALTKNTKAVIPTNLFGYPCDIEALNDRLKGKLEGQLIIQDCALAYGTKVLGKERLIANEGDAAIYAMGIGKPMTTFDGGMLTTDDYTLYQKTKEYRDANFSSYPFLGSVMKAGKILAELMATRNLAYSFTYGAWKHGLLDWRTKYYSEDEITMPKNHDQLFSSLQAEIGKAQLKKIPEITERRRSIAAYYDRRLKDVQGITLPPLMKEATYSHYVPRVADRNAFAERMAERGIHVGHLFEYAIPYMKPYAGYKDKEYPFSLACANEVVNLPNYPGLRKKDMAKIADAAIESATC